MAGITAAASPLPASAQHGERHHRMQRLKVGLTGLALVLMLIGLASAVFNSVNRERPVSAAGTAQPGTIAAMAADPNANTAGSPDAMAEIGAAPAVDSTNQNAAVTK